MTMLRKMIPAILLTASLATIGFAQVDNGPGGPGGPGGPPDFAQMRQQMEDRMKEQLNVNDDQWDSLQPKIQKVQQLKRELRVGGGPGGPGGFGRGPGGPGRQGNQGGANNTTNPGGRRGGFGPPGMDANSPVQQALSSLREAIRNNASEDTVQAKLATYRKAIADAKAQLETAQKELTAATNAHQQAVLVSMNILD
ncbi:MAG: hypothetical protein ACTHN5_14655 [Phycisphaerae bacterium]